MSTAALAADGIALGALPRGRFMPRCQVAVAVFCTLILICNVPIYAFESGWLPVPPFYWVLLLGAAAFPLALSDRRLLPVLASPPLVWLLCVTGLAAVAFLRSDQSAAALQTFQDLLLAGLIMLVLWLVLSWGQACQRAALRTVVACLLLLVVAVVWDLTHPYSFMPLGHPHASVGRGAATFINPNQAGAAFALGMIVTLRSVSARWRALYALALLVGVLATFSRTALLAWLLAAAAFWWARVIPRYSLLVGMVVVGIGAAVLMQFVLGGGLGADVQSFNVEESLSRVQWLTELGGGGDGGVSISSSGQDDSTTIRLAVLQDAMTMFANHPLLGNGLASTVTWNHPVSTHNIYAAHLADYGIIGILIFPALVATVVAGHVRQRRVDAWVLGSCMLIVGLFSHDVLTEHYLVLIYLLGATGLKVAA
jgi:O-antigen ligase